MITPKHERAKVRRQYIELRKTAAFQILVAHLYRRQNKRCVYCRTRIWASKPQSFHVDHKTPIYRGGTNDFSNFVLSCPACNLFKGAEYLPTYKEQRRYEYLTQQQAATINRVGREWNHDLDMEMFARIAREP